MKHRLDVLFRIIAAIIGGYLVSISFSFALVPILVWSGACGRNEAVMVSTMLSYLVYFSVIIISFYRHSALVLWRDIVLIVGLFSSTFILLGDG